MYCTNSDKRLLIDVVFLIQQLSDSVVLASFVKTFEVKDQYYLLIMLPSLTKSALDLANFYNIA